MGWWRRAGGDSSRWASRPPRRCWPSAPESGTAPDPGRPSVTDGGKASLGPARVPVPRVVPGKDEGHRPQANGAQRHGPPDRTRRQVEDRPHGRSCRLQAPSGGRHRRTGGRKGPRPEKRGERSEVPLFDRAGSLPDRISMLIRPAGDGGRKPTHPAFIPWACTRLPKATSVLFCPPHPGASRSENRRMSRPKWGEGMVVKKRSYIGIVTV
jgi:hypothetical protein